jgi:hypothetical protein
MWPKMLLRMARRRGTIPPIGEPPAKDGGAHSSNYIENFWIALATERRSVRVVIDDLAARK